MQHKDIPDSELHETRGANSASANQVHYSAGSGATGWAKVTSSMIDTSSIKNINKACLSVAVSSVGAAFDVYLPIPFNATLDSVTAVINNTIGAGTLTTSVYNNTNLVGTFDYTTSDTAGSQRNPSSYSNTTFTAGSNLRVQSTASGVTSSATMVLTLVFTLT